MGTTCVVRFGQRPFDQAPEGEELVFLLRCLELPERLQELNEVLTLSQFDRRVPQAFHVAVQLYRNQLLVSLAPIQRMETCLVTAGP